MPNHNSTLLPSFSSAWNHHYKIFTCTQTRNIHIVAVTCRDFYFAQLRHTIFYDKHIFLFAFGAHRSSRHAHSKGSLGFSSSIGSAFMKATFTPMSGKNTRITYLETNAHFYRSFLAICSGNNCDNFSRNFPIGISLQHCLHKLLYP